MAILVVYAVFLLALGYLEFKKRNGLINFLVANRQSGVREISLSIISTCVGGTATIGIVGNVYIKGFPAIWWLLSGALGLLVLAFFLSKIVRRTNALTMPEIIEHYIGKNARTISAVIICVAWCAILAAQFSAGARIIAAFGIGYEMALYIGAFVIIAYTILGGQASVLKSDVYQYGVVIVAFLAVLAWLWFARDSTFSGVKFELVNDKFTYTDVAYYLLIIGSSYIIDPMLFSRLLSAKDEKTALRGAVWGSFGISVSAFVIVIVGFGAISMATDVNPDELLTKTLFSNMPNTLGLVLLLGLLSAIISSADTCLITASSIFCHDLLKTKKLWLYRTMTLVFGVVALGLTYYGKSILGYLFAANDIYVSGVVVPVFFAMVFKGRVDSTLITFGMVLGGGLGLVAAFSDVKTYSLVGIAISATLSIIAHLKLRFASIEAEDIRC